MPLDPRADPAILGAIYDCALDPDGWPDVLGAICEAIDLCNANLSLIDPWSATLYLSVTAGIEPDWLAAMPSHVEEGVRLFGGASALERYEVGELVVLSSVCEASAFRASGFYRDWARPQGISDLMATKLVRDRTAMCSLGFGRHARFGLLDREAVSRVSHFLPHIRRAVLISRLIEAQRVVANTLAETLGALRVAVMLVDASLLPVVVNAAAQRLIDRGWPLTVRAGAIAAAEDVAHKRLFQTIKAWSRTGHDGSNGCVRIPTRGVGECAILHVLSLSGCATRSRIAPEAVAAIFVGQSGSGSAGLREDVAALFDLTPKEARVFEHIAAGRSPAEVARLLGVRASTVRTHLLRVFEKTGAHRQSELVALATDFTSPLTQVDAIRNPSSDRPRL